jgi:hypothetical protein
VASARPAELLPDRLQNAAPGEPVELWIYSAFPKDNWLARKAADWTHAEYPGTAIQIGGKLYEIMLVEETIQGGYATRYGLKGWDPHHAVRQTFTYTPQTLARTAADYLEEKHRLELRARLLWLFPLAGLAPDPVQREWEKKTALNMTWASVGSAVTGLLLAFLLRQTLGVYADHPVLLLPVYYIGLESFLRLLWITFTQKPHGTLVLTLPYILWEGVARPEKREREKAEWLKFSYEGDEVIRRPGTGNLLVRSMLFDDILAGPSPLCFEGAVYRTLHWHREGKGLLRRWVYELEKTEADPKRKYREYTQPRTPERQKLVEAFTHSLDITQSFALFWGIYPQREQFRLAIKYQYAGAKYTAITAGFFLLLALLQIWLSILWHTTVFAITGPVYLICESLYRLYRSKVQGQPAGSLVGYVLGLVIHPPK